MGEAVLIFPAGHPGGPEFRVRMAGEGRRVVGASSLDYDPASEAYGTWSKLPFVSDPGFADALKALIAEHDIGEIYTPHYVIWLHLSKVLNDLAPGVVLQGKSNIDDAERGYRVLQDRMGQVAPPALFDTALPMRPALTPARLAGTMRLVETIPGMSSEEKLLAVIDIVRCAPTGDIVEIGSWWGKSAALFVLLSKHYAIGPVLCCDPWAVEALAQGDALLDAASAAADMDQALRIFEMNLAPLADGRLNYLRAPSTQGATRYGPGLMLANETFGEVVYEGQIAVLHIDGNHSFENVEADARAWIPFVKPGGWIIFDDYFWVFGDGPRRVGDDFCRDHAARIQLSFVAGKALFVQLKA